MTGEQARAVGELMASSRAKLGLTFAQLESRTGLPGTWLFHVEKGHYNDPAPERLARSPGR